jgi:hypothetical protein
MEVEEHMGIRRFLGKRSPGGTQSDAYLVAYLDTDPTAVNNN